jgi:SAM-dependent methyltransferase
VFEKAGPALDELLRVTRPGGVVAFSVMSRWGSLHRTLEAVLALDRRGFSEENRRVVMDGDLLGEVARVEGMTLSHECHLFTWEEIEVLLAGRACELIDASAAGFLGLRADDALAELSEEEWARHLAREEVACRARGVLDAGTHTIVAVRKLDAGSAGAPPVR